MKLLEVVTSLYIYQQVSMVVQGEGDQQEGWNQVQVSTPVPTNVFTGNL